MYLYEEYMYQYKNVCVYIYICKYIYVWDIHELLSQIFPRIKIARRSKGLWRIKGDRVINPLSPSTPSYDTQGIWSQEWLSLPPSMTHGCWELPCLKTKSKRHSHPNPVNLSEGRRNRQSSLPRNRPSSLLWMNCLKLLLLFWII